MREFFISGFLKKAQQAGLTKLDALDVLKQANWFGDRWTDIADWLNTSTSNLTNNDISHFFSAATSTSPKGYFDGFGERIQNSKDISNIENMNTFYRAARHQMEQGDHSAMQDYLEKARQYNGWIQNPIAMEQGTKMNDMITDRWNSAQEQKFNAQKAIDDSRSNIWNRLQGSKPLAAPGQLVSTPKPITPDSSSEPTLPTHFGVGSALNTPAQDNVRPVLGK